MAKVILKDVKKVFDNNVVAVQDINIEIQDREFIVLVGPSGCGKSTTLRMIAGLEEVTEGQIYIGDRLVNNVPPKDRDIAMVFQNYALYPHMTVYENMAFGLKLRKFPKEEIHQRVLEAAKILNITSFLDRRPKALSGGQRQRVAVGRAIVRKPKVFLFDEPLSNLDAKLRVQMRTEISKLHSQLQSTMIYVTHDQTEAMTMGDRIVVLNDGIIQQIDTPLTLYENPKNKFVAGFIGSPPMNFIDGKIIREDGIKFVEDGMKIRVGKKAEEKLSKYVDKDITLGFRAEHVFLKEQADKIEDKAEIKATVEVVEPMGKEIFLYMTTGISPFVACIEGASQPEVDQTLDMVIDLSKVHFFDYDTEEAIV
ncbi:MAG: ABC transporter ATP-binding protein [Candidatus Odinarchaeia archaeon]